jgi:hypothetical protein
MANSQTSASSGDIQNTFGAMSGAASPKLLYTSFLLGMCRDYFALMLRPESELSNQTIDKATATLIAFCPDKQTRVKLWEEYIVKTKEAGDDSGKVATASIHTIGDLIDFLTSVLDLSDSASAGFL